jgi:hypothetical protein
MTEESTFCHCEEAQRLRQSQPPQKNFFNSPTVAARFNWSILIYKLTILAFGKPKTPCPVCRPGNVSYILLIL